MSEEKVTLDQFREAKENGTLYSQPEPADSEQDDYVANYDEEPDGYDDDTETPTESDYEEPDDMDVDDEEDEYELPDERQKTAFQKRMEREDAKMRERLTAEYEEKYGKFKQVFDKHGLTPEMVEQGFQQREEARAVQNVMGNNPYMSEYEAAMYVQNQRLLIGQEIRKIAPNHPGMEAMSPAIIQKMEQFPGMDIETAYYATGGKALNEQLMREQAQREIHKRQQTKRTVVSDFAESPVVGPKPLMAEEIRAAKHLGMSEKQMRAMRDSDFKDLEGYRRWAKKQSKNAR